MDVIIVGAGLAGLHCALRISEKSKQKILLLESYSEPGGRVSTVQKGKLHFDATDNFKNYWQAAGINQGKK